MPHAEVCTQFTGPLGSFMDGEGNIIKWGYIVQLQNLQIEEGLNMANKLTTNHLKFEKHKINDRLAAQTLSSSVANAIDFLDKSVKLPNFSGSSATVLFIRTIDRLFDLLNSRNPWAKGFKAPLRLSSRDTWQEILLSTAEYLLSLKTTTSVPQPLSTSQRKTFVIGFVTCFKSTILMATQMLSLSTNPFQYLLTYKLSQDHIELLFSCIRSRGGWNNNPNSLQMKYTLRKMLMRNAINASKNANCVDFTGCNNLIPLFHTRKHKTDTNEDSKQATVPHQATDQEDKEMNTMLQRLNEGHSEFISNVLYYIAGYIVSKLIDNLSCSKCKKSLLSLPRETSVDDHDYTATRYNEAGKASAFTTFVNQGGLQIPSTVVYPCIEFCEHVFRATVTGSDGQHISNKAKLKNRMIINVCQHFALESTLPLFADHDDGDNEAVVEDDYRTQLTKRVAVKYFTLRLFNYGKKYTIEIINKGKQSDRHRLNKLTFLIINKLNAFKC